MILTQQEVFLTTYELRSEFPIAVLTVSANNYKERK